jgi:predicted HTH transcriptional regulator
VDKTADKGETKNDAADTISGTSETICSPDETTSDMALGPAEEMVVRLLLSDPYATYGKLADETGHSRSKVARTVRGLRERGILERAGSRKEWFWEVAAGIDPSYASTDR